MKLCQQNLHQTSVGKDLLHEWNWIFKLQKLQERKYKRQGLLHFFYSTRLTNEGPGETTDRPLVEEQSLHEGSSVAEYSHPKFSFESQSKPVSSARSEQLVSSPDTSLRSSSTEADKVIPTVNSTTASSDANSQHTSPELEKSGHTRGTFRMTRFLASSVSFHIKIAKSSTIGCVSVCILNTMTKINK